jgi:transcriptional regulator with XRE-family HTH domain
MDTKSLRGRIAESDILLSQFAEMSGLGLNNLSDILHGRNVPGPEVQRRIERALVQLETNPPARLVITRGTPRKTEVAS